MEHSSRMLVQLRSLIFLGDCDWDSLSLCLSLEGVYNDQQETNEEDQEDR